MEGCAADLGGEVGVGLAGHAAGDDVQEEVGRVLVGRQLKADRDEVRQRGAAAHMQFLLVDVASAV